MKRVASKTQKFRMICQVPENPNIILFASRISQQLPMYIWKSDPFSRRVDAFQLYWGIRKGYALSSFYLIRKVLRKVQIIIATIIPITLILAKASLVPKSPNNEHKKSNSNSQNRFIDLLYS